MKKLISIGKMAEINKTTIATLRLYDKKDLLKPIYTDNETGYRYYSINQNSRLDMINYMKELGMSLSEIETVLKKEDITLIEEILAKKREQIKIQIEELENRSKAVIRAIDNIERYRKSPKSKTLTLEYINERNIVSVKCKKNFYKLGIEAYEDELNKFREELIDSKFEQIHSYIVITTIKKNDFIKNDLIPDTLAIITDHKINTSLTERTLEAGMYACIYIDSFDEEIDAIDKLRKYCLSNNYQINGDYICEVMTEFNIFDSEQRNMYLRLQVPVKFN